MYFPRCFSSKKLIYSYRYFELKPGKVMSTLVFIFNRSAKQKIPDPRQGLLTHDLIRGIVLVDEE